jgi:cell division protein FtsB
MRYLFFIIGLTFLSIQYKLWLGDGSLIAWFNMEKKIKTQIAINKSIEQQNHALHANIQELKQGDQALEEEARQEFGMIKKNETYYQFIE